MTYMANKKALTKDELERKKEYAKLLYVEQGVTDQRELSRRTGISLTTINKWINANDFEWKRLRQSFLITKDQELRRLYAQLTELNDAIEKKDEGKRYADSKEADVIVKITSAIRQLEVDTSAADAMSVMKEFIPFTREVSPDIVSELIPVIDMFVKKLINKSK